MSELIKAINAMTASSAGWDSHKEMAIKTIIEICDHYAEWLQVEPVDIFNALEQKRSYSYPNYYQWANFPRLDSDVKIFENIGDLHLAFQPAKGFICPACERVSKNPYECDATKNASKSVKKCDWKSYGLLRTMGKGLRFTVKDTFLEKPIVDECFMPVALINNDEGK